MEATASAISAGNEFLNGIFDALGLSIDIQHRVDGDRIVYEVSGDTELLKRRPNLVTAVTLLTSQTASRIDGQRLSCVLDIDGQLESRRELLKIAATDVARAVQKNGRRAIFEGLNSTERRIVHTALKGDEFVETESEGDEGQRRLIVRSINE